MAQEIMQQGKYFSNLIHKQALRVIVHTPSCRVEGVVHLHPEHRLLDELNKGASPFMAITDATILANGQQTRLAFMALRKESIEWVYPFDEVIEGAA